MLQGGVHELLWQDFPHYWPLHLPMSYTPCWHLGQNYFTVIGEYLHTVGISYTTYLPCLVNAVCERPQTKKIQSSLLQLIRLSCCQIFDNELRITILLMPTYLILFWLKLNYIFLPTFHTDYNELFLSRQILTYCIDSTVFSRFEGRISERLEKYNMIIYEIKVLLPSDNYTVFHFFFFAQICSKLEVLFIHTYVSMYFEPTIWRLFRLIWL